MCNVSQSVSTVEFCIKLHPRQKCFEDLCVPFCVGKQAADLSRFNFFSNRIAKKFKSNLKTNRGLFNGIFIVQIESPNVQKLRFKSCSRDWNAPITVLGLCVLLQGMAVLRLLRGFLGWDGFRDGLKVYSHFHYLLFSERRKNTDRKVFVLQYFELKSIAI